MTAPTTPLLPETTSERLIAIEQRACRTRAALGADHRAGDRPDIALAAVQQVSDELLEVVMALDYGTPLAWQLLRVRESLDSHVIAAAGIANTGAYSSSLIDLLRRGLDTLVVELASARSEP